MIQQRLLMAFTLPFFVWSGLFQHPGFAHSRYATVVKGSESSLRILQDHASIQQHQPQSYHANFLLALAPEQAKVVPFQPGCQETDKLCTVWSEFRIPRPYPTQRIAAKSISANEMILVISEPSNSLSKPQWQALVKSIFSTDLLEYRTFKWMIGVDGWVEDIVLRVKKPDSQENLLSHTLTHDRIALLNIAMFGSSAGANIESIEPAQSNKTITKIPNLRLSAGEVLNWFTDRKAGWQTLNAPSYEVKHWLDQTSVGTRQVLTSADRTLVLLTFPLSDVLAARRTGALPEPLKIAFREFAVNSDILISGAWSTDQVAILARSRQVPTKDFPPLRTDTFELIATQKTTELYQSYERTNLFAGKLQTGEYESRDWAPILLSPALINTEFGALLNITDQMLKSWSQAGQVEYLYFDYPYKPNVFPFNGTPLSEIVREKTGSQQVRFNWNTTGMGSVISGKPSILIPTQTGALPITYDPELAQKGELQTGQLRQYEEKAYDYFANLQDPNLATVVQYTLLYQLLLAAAPIKAEVVPPQPNKGSQVLTNYALDFIKKVDTTNGGDLVKAKELISAFRKAHPDVNNQQLAALIADPGASQTQPARINEYSSLVAEFNAKEESRQNAIKQYNNEVSKLQDAIKQYNNEVSRLNRQRTTDPSESSRLKEWSASIEAGKRKLKALDNDLAQRQAELERLQQRLVSLDKLRTQAETESEILSSKVQQLVAQLKESTNRDEYIDRVRIAFSNAHSAPPDSWIKTPASVLSWGNEGGQISRSVGGHNLNSHALQFKESSSINNVRVIKTGSRRVVEYPPSQRERILANAAAIARAVEHDGVTDPKILLQIGQTVKSRPRSVALEISKPPTTPPKLGDETLVGELQDLVAKNGCCLTYVDTGKDGWRYLAITNPSPPPPARITPFGDTPSFVQYVREQLKPPGSNSPIIFRGSREQAEAIARSLIGNPSPTQMEWLTALADLNNRPARPLGDSITVLRYGRNKRLTSLQINLGAESGPKSPVSRVLERLSARFKPNTASVQEVTNLPLDLKLTPKWQKAANQGELATIQLSYTEQGSIVTPTDVYISSITNRSEVTMVRTKMATAANDVITSRGTKEAVTLDTLIDIKEQIELQLGDLSVEQLEMFLKGTYSITNRSRRGSGS